MTQRASPREVAKLIAFLRTDPNAAGYADPVERGQLIALHETVVGRDAVGRLSTLFRELGSVHAQKTTGSEFFRLRDVLPTLRRPDCTDRRSLTLVEEYIAAARAGTLRDRTITAVATAAGPMLVDGNKRATALYEASSAADLTLSFLLLVPPSAAQA